MGFAANPAGSEQFRVSGCDDADGKSIAMDLALDRRPSRKDAIKTINPNRPRERLMLAK
jgi:hypothetical protein